MKLSEFERLLIEDGWYIKTTGKHKKYVHPKKKDLYLLENTKVRKLRKELLKV